MGNIIALVTKNATGFFGKVVHSYFHFSPFYDRIKTASKTPRGLGNTGEDEV
jgi:hypothetical protein